jgi:hypothetical protein
MTETPEQPMTASAAVRAAVGIPRLLGDLSAYLNEAPPLPAVQVEEVARTVALFLEGVPRSGAAVRAALLSARAFAALGAPSVARRLLLHGTGLARPDRWSAAGAAVLWTIDVSRLEGAAGAPLELALFRALDAALAGLAELWDRPSGAGALGLRRAGRAAGRLLSVSSRSRAARGLASEMRGRCAARLADIARGRGWHAVPAVLLLDG